ncbi:YfhO family protein [Nitrospiraceae bacterium AH_259_D15_M11_P09]|nr:YfhO family protein [Nitrospiraceae bacterium AH_259_D15_M11_P09]
MSKEPKGLVNGVSVSGVNRIVARLGASTGVAVAGLCTLVLLFYNRLWLPDLVLIKRDAFRFFLPLKQYVIERLSAGELPQWFPYDGLGRPLIGASGLGIFHPFTALYFLFPVPDAYRATTLLSCLAAALGAFVLGRILALSRGGAVLAGVAFALSGYVVSLTDNILYLYSVCLLPLFCAALEKALMEGRTWVVAPAILWATVFLNGDIQTGYYYGLIALLWTGMRAPRTYREAGLRLVCIAGLAALLSGIQLGPAWAAFLTSDRAQTALFHEQALHWSTHPLRLLSIVASLGSGEAHPPDVASLFFGSQSAAGGASGLWAESLYIGIPVAGLALLGALLRRDLRVLAVVGGLALLLALGRNGGLYEAFYHLVPFWSAFRYPEKLLGVFSFAAAMLAGAGFDAFRQGWTRAVPWFAAALLCGGTWLCLGAEFASAWVASNLGTPVELAREVTNSAAVAFLFSALATMGVGLVAVGIQRNLVRRELLLGLLIAIMALDLWRANLEAYHTGPVEVATFSPGLAKAVVRHAGVSGPGHFRLVSVDETEVVYPEPIEQWLDQAGITSMMLRQSLDLEHNAQFRLESAKGYLHGSTSAFGPLVGHKLGLEANARYNVAYLIGRRYHFQGPRFARALVAVNTDYDLALVENPVPATPRAYLSPRPEPTASPVDLLTLLERTDFLSGEVDVIETSEANLPRPTQDGQVAIEHYAPEEIRLRVETAQQAVLILLDAFNAGWRATLENGDEIPILRANGLVRALVVPAGLHVVTFAYRTPLLREGAIVSLAGIVIGVVLIARTWWPRRKSSGILPIA